MQKLMSLCAILGLGACVYGNPVNYENFFSQSDITKVDWSKVDGKGSSCQTNWFFGLITAGSNSLASAVERAEISKIAYVDTDTVLYLPLLMTRECTNVYGELTPSARAAMAYYDKEDDIPAPKAKPAVEEKDSKPDPVSASDYDFPAGN